MIGRARTSLRSSTAAGMLLVRRRARRDGPLLAAWTLTVAFASLLAIVGPAHLTETIDAGAREAVETAGSASDLVVTASVDAANDQLPTLSPTQVEPEMEILAGRLPDAVSLTLGPSTVAATGPALLVAATDVQPPLSGPETRLRLVPVIATSQNLDALEVVAGELPTETDADPGRPIPVLISAASAQASSLDVGSVIALPVADADIRQPTALRAQVVGIARERPEGSERGSERFSPWRDVNQMWAPADLSDDRSTFVGIAILMSPASADRIIRSQGASFTALFRYSFDPAAFTGDRLIDAVEASKKLVANIEGLTASTGESFPVSSGLADAVVDFPDTARAALAEISIIVAGVVGASGTVLVLASRLIVARRLPDLLLQRARGSSLVAICLRNLAEAVIVVIVAVLIAGVVAGTSRLARIDDMTPLLLVASVALLAGAVQIMAVLRERSTASTIGVNRRDALARRRQSRAARLAGELAVLVLAVGSVLALRGRGLLQTESEEIDPLIAGAPLFVAGAVTVLTLRAARLLARGAAVAAGLSRGISGPVVSSRLPRGIAVVPLTAFTIAIALAVSTGIIWSTVRSGQLDASWQVVGADVRVDGVNAQDVARVAAAEGVDAASGFTTDSARLALVTGDTRVTLVAVDRGYPGLVSQLPDIEGVMDRSNATSLSLLSQGLRDAAPVPAVVDDAIADRLPPGEVTLQIGGEEIALQVVGTMRSGVAGSAGGSRVFVDLVGLADRVSSTLGVDSLLALGPGAANAASRLDLTDTEVVTRIGWLEDRRRLALIAGVEQAMLAGTAALTLLALIAVICTALAGSRERARYLALLRTLGVRPRFGVFLATIDQLPLMLASLAGGVLAGCGTVVVLSPALGLEFLTGGLSAPVLSIPPFFVLQTAGGVALVFAIGTLIEVLLRRRDRVSDTIRIGETI